MRCVTVAVCKTKSRAETQINMRARTRSHMRARLVAVVDSAVANESSGLGVASCKLISIADWFSIRCDP